MKLPPSFDPKQFDEVPLTGQKLFDPDSFSSPQNHQAAENWAREQIVECLTTKHSRPCHSRENLKSIGYMKRHGIDIADIASGKIRVV